jgi:hypothetical protein
MDRQSLDWRGVVILLFVALMITGVVVALRNLPVISGVVPN